MLNHIFRWERQRQILDDEGNWVPDPEREPKVSYCTPYWMRCKTGSEEIRFFQAMDAEVTVCKEGSGVTRFTNTSPDGKMRSDETFTIVNLADIYDHAHKRVLNAAESMREIPHRVEDGQTIITLTDPDDPDTKAELVLETLTWKEAEDAE